MPYYRQILDQIAEQIRRGELAAGAPLPSARALAKDLLVSMITTRRAYAELESLGLVRRRRGRGTFVADDVQPRARHASAACAAEVLTRAINEALELGLNPDAVRRVVDQHLQRQQGDAA